MQRRMVTLILLLVVVLADPSAAEWIHRGMPPDPENWLYFTQGPGYFGRGLKSHDHSSSDRGGNVLNNTILNNPTLNNVTYGGPTTITTLTITNLSSSVGFTTRLWFGSPFLQDADLSYDTSTDTLRTLITRAATGVVPTGSSFNQWAYQVDLGRTAGGNPVYSGLNLSHGPGVDGSTDDPVVAVGFNPNRRNISDAAIWRQWEGDWCPIAGCTLNGGANDRLAEENATLSGTDGSSTLRYYDFNLNPA